MITAKVEMTAKDKAYESGTDNASLKPIGSPAFILRIKALLRRFQMINEEKIHIGNTVINRKSYEVEAAGKTFILPLKEFELLAQLASYPDRIFSREELIDLVWGNDFIGSDLTVDVHIKRLRERFSAEQHQFVIQTVRGLGYKLEEV